MGGYARMDGCMHACACMPARMHASLLLCVNVYMRRHDYKSIDCAEETVGKSRDIPHKAGRK